MAGGGGIGGLKVWGLALEFQSGQKYTRTFQKLRTCLHSVAMHCELDGTDKPTATLGAKDSWL